MYDTYFTYLLRGWNIIQIHVFITRPDPYAPCRPTTTLPMLTLTVRLARLPSKSTRGKSYVDCIICMHKVKLNSPIQTPIRIHGLCRHLHHHHHQLYHHLHHHLHSSTVTYTIISAITITSTSTITSPPPAPPPPPLMSPQ